MVIEEGTRMELNSYRWVVISERFLVILWLLIGSLDSEEIGCQ
jgi:hypothetical protein